MKLISETKALAKLDHVTAKLRGEVAGYEERAKSCRTCETPGACCLDAHFVNVRISRLEAVKIRGVLARFDEVARGKVESRITTAIEKYGLNDSENDREHNFACPLFEPGVGCLVHDTAKPVPCMVHACYDKPSHLPPDSLQTEAEAAIDRLNTMTYGSSQPLLPLPVAVR